MKPSESCRFRLIGAAWGGLCRNRHDVPFEQLPFSTIWQEIVPAQTRSLRRALPEYIKKKTAAPHFGTLPIVRLAAFRSLLAERSQGEIRAVRSVPPDVDVHKRAPLSDAQVLHKLAADWHDVLRHGMGQPAPLALALARQKASAKRPLEHRKTATHQTQRKRRRLPSQNRPKILPTPHAIPQSPLTFAGSCLNGQFRCAHVPYRV
mmetsp:Transcript_16356/g.42161  ORF Transcript_16356/g.42161 Transcript_16356/m.42161 type:complete len:206 (-) Transcript_16356:99-716(-)